MNKQFEANNLRVMDYRMEPTGKDSILLKESRSQAWSRSKYNHDPLYIAQALCTTQHTINTCEQTQTSNLLLHTIYSQGKEDTYLKV